MTGGPPLFAVPVLLQAVPAAVGAPDQAVGKLPTCGVKGIVTGVQDVPTGWAGGALNWQSPLPGKRLNVAGPEQVVVPPTTQPQVQVVGVNVSPVR